MTFKMVSIINTLAVHMIPNGKIQMTFGVKFLRLYNVYYSILYIFIKACIKHNYVNDINLTV